MVTLFTDGQMKLIRACAEECVSESGKCDERAVFDTLIIARGWTEAQADVLFHCAHECEVRHLGAMKVYEVAAQLQVTHRSCDEILSEQVRAATDLVAPGSALLLVPITHVENAVEIPVHVARRTNMGPFSLN